MRRVDNTLVADGDESVSEFARLPFGKPLHVEIKQPRNLQFHKLYWSLVHRIADGVGANPESVSDLFKISTGHCTVIKSKTHGIIKLPKSISFAKMDADSFRVFFEACVRTLYDEWGIDPSAVADLLAPQSTHLQERIKQVGK